MDYSFSGSQVRARWLWNSALGGSLTARHWP